MNCQALESKRIESWFPQRSIETALTRVFAPHTPALFQQPASLTDCALFFESFTGNLP